MTFLKTALLAAAATAAIATVPAQAAVTFIVNGTFTTQTPGSGTPIPQGTLTGTFTTDDAFRTITDYALIASPTPSFVGFAYSPVTATVSANNLPGFFQLNDTLFNGSAFELRLIFARNLGTATTIAFDPTSYEYELLSGQRFLSGSVTQQATTTPVPEPTAWAMLILGMGAVGYSMRRRSAAFRLA